MKKLLFGMVGAMALIVAGTAGAADLSPAPLYKAPPPVEVPWSWTGFYGGGHFGAGWGSKDWDFTGLSETDSGVVVGTEPFDINNSFPVNGFLGGVQLGYRYQTGRWVYGVEGSFSWADINGKSGCGNFDAGIIGFNCSSQANMLGTLTGQVGWAVDHALIYFKGGAAWIHDEHSISSQEFDGEVLIPCGGPLTCNFSNNEWRVGGLVGAGISYAFDPKWSAFIEYNYMDFGNRNSTFSACEAPYCDNFTFNIDQQIHVIKAGVNYRFNWGG